LAEVPGPGLSFRFVAQGEGRVVLEPRVHLAPPNGGARHFNVLRGHLLERRSGGEIVAGTAPGRERPEERTLFWHRGLATTDLAVAGLLLRRAADAGLGTLLRYR
jgi:alanine dehydrogenase